MVGAFPDASLEDGQVISVSARFEWSQNFESASDMGTILMFVRTWSGGSEVVCEEPINAVLNLLAYITL